VIGLSMFCPRCGSLMVPSKQGGLECPRCGFREDKGGLVMYATRVRRNPGERMVVIDSDKPRSAMPRTRDVRCPRCGNDEAEYWFLQTRRADEPPTRFYRCVKCGHVWREYE